VIAGVRTPSTATVLNALQKTNSRLSIVTLDLASDQSVKDAAKEIEKAHPKGIDYLIVNGAIVGNPGLASVDLLSVMNTNVAGSLRVITEFLPLVRKGNRKVISTISSIAGAFASQDMLLGYYHSVGEKDPLMYAYRASKAALNLLTVAFAKDNSKDGIIIVPVHPGMVETEGYIGTGAKKDGNPYLISPTESAKQQMALFHKLKIEDSGKFFNYDGNVIPF